MARQRKTNRALHGSPIEDYCLIGDCETAALVSKHGSIDWLCWPDFSSGACFAALLGTKDHGYWSLAPTAKVKSSRRRYVDDTLVLETTFVTRGGEVLVTDFMPPRSGCSHLIRIVRGVRGRVKMRMELALRFDYGRTVPWVTHAKSGLNAIAGDDMAVLRTSAPLRGEGLTTVSEFTVKADQVVSFVLTGGSSIEKFPPAPNTQRALRSTKRFWSGWAKRGTYRGAYQDAVRRSLITLKALTYRPSGGIVAAVTTSLPEQIGGGRNWDYRFCWIRDTSFTLLALLAAGYDEEAVAWREWLMRTIAGAPDQVQALYGVRGERQLTEWEADWLPGYEGSKPVRIGNGATGQFQLDVFGELASALARTPEAKGRERISATALQAALIDHVCKVWQEPDEGIWETRGGRKHFTHSKVMAWAALDRAIRNYERFDGFGDVERWRKNRDMIHREVCAKGFNKRLNSFVQSYGSTQLDASCLRIVLVGFLPPEDPRIRGTVEAIERDLMRKGFVLRYNTKNFRDGLQGSEGAFLACSFWMVSNLWLIGRKADAKALYERLLGLRNDVGLLSEEYDPVRRRLVGNFPQALSHIALIHAAFTISGTWRPQAYGDQRT
ncbi:glycoside hydrolase family 15 protein [Granulicella sp. dw_53]|uniref:glycoside hydrolase family 15 protein n=1 Tax=Granulicella sp. dw_53 TaxID=2719792 RepID=UPI0031F720A5